MERFSFESRNLIGLALTISTQLAQLATLNSQLTNREESCRDALAHALRDSYM